MELSTAIAVPGATCSYTFLFSGSNNTTRVQHIEEFVPFMRLPPAHPEKTHARTCAVGGGMFYPYAHVRMQALIGLACCARVTPASSHASLCSGKALTSPASLACDSARPFRTRFCSMPFGENKGYQRHTHEHTHGVSYHRCAMYFFPDLTGHEPCSVASSSARSG